MKQTVNTYPHAAYDDLGEVITSLGIGEAVVTVMDERGAPTPVAWTRLRAPESRMAPADADAMAAAVQASPLFARYAERIDRDSAHERLAAKLERGAEKARAEERIEYPKRPAPKQGSVVTDILTSPEAKDLMRTAAREILRGVFRTGRR